MIIGKREIAGNIYRKFNKAVYRKHIYDVINIVCDYIVDEISQDNVVSVDNFGTFYATTFHGHTGYDLETGNLREFEPFRTVKFRPHHTFNLLFNRKRNKFGSKKRKFLPSRFTTEKKP